MKKFAHVFIALSLFALNLQANTPPKNTLVVKTVTYKLNLHWPTSGKDVLLIAAPVSIAEDNVIPKKGINYSADLKFGKGSVVGNGFVVYKGKESAITISELESGHMYYFSSFEADANGDYTIPGPGITSFMCFSLGQQAQLNWKSVSGNENIIVERSDDSKTWKELKTPGTLATAPELPGYNFVDMGPLNGDYFYRIKQTYDDKQTVISNPLSVKSFSMTNVFEVLPKDEEQNLYFIVSDAKTDLTITNAKGELIKTAVLDEKNSYSFFLNDMPAGIYNITGKNYNGVLSKKITFD